MAKALSEPETPSKRWAVQETIKNSLRLKLKTKQKNKKDN
jgi:hypothetical protein